MTDKQQKMGEEDANKISTLVWLHQYILHKINITN